MGPYQRIFPYDLIREETRWLLRKVKLSGKQKEVQDLTIPIDEWQDFSPGPNLFSILVSSGGKLILGRQRDNLTKGGDGSQE